MNQEIRRKEIQEARRKELQKEGWKSLDEILGKIGAEKKSIDEMNRILPPAIKAMRDFRERNNKSFGRIC